MNDESEFDSLLRGKFKNEREYLEDDGFSACVMQQLPKETKPNITLDIMLSWLITGLISALVLYQFPWRDLVRSIYGFLLIHASSNSIETIIVIVLFATIGLYKQYKNI